MTPKEKAIQLFEEHELWLIEKDKWITVVRIKDSALHKVSCILRLYQNTPHQNNQDNARRIRFWVEVGVEIKNLYS